MLLITVTLPFAVVVFAPMLVPVLLVGVFNAYHRMSCEDFEELIAPERFIVTMAEGTSFPLGPLEWAREILDRAAKTAYQMSRVIGFEETPSSRSFRVYGSEVSIAQHCTGRITLLPKL
jgi:hypothetical protein